MPSCWGLLSILMECLQVLCPILYVLILGHKKPLQQGRGLGSVLLLCDWFVASECFRAWLFSLRE